MTRFQVDEVYEGRGAALLFGTYRQLEKISESYQGATFKSYHPALQKPVALTILKPEWLLPLDSTDTYIPRVQHASTVNHPHLVSILDAGVINGIPFIVEEFCDGTDLNYFINEMGAVPANLGIDFIRQAALGLQAAHEKGVIHGELHPGSLILSPVTRSPVSNGSPGHFQVRPAPGASIKVQGIGCTPIRPALSELTLKQSPLLSRIDFIAPERVTREQGDIRSDIYSLGACLYFLLAARAPFKSANEVEAMWNLQFGRIMPIGEMRTDVPWYIANLIHGMLSRDPNQRPQSLAQVLATIQGTTPPVSTPKVPSPPVLVASETMSFPSALPQIIQQTNQNPAQTIPDSFGAALARVMAPPPPPAMQMPTFPPPAAVPLPIFEPLPSAIGRAHFGSPPPIQDLSNLEAPPRNHYEAPQEIHHDPFAHSGHDAFDSEPSRPRPKKAKKSIAAIWIVIGLMLHVGAILLLVGFFMGWFDKPSSLVPEGKEIKQPQNPTKKKKLS